MTDNAPILIAEGVRFAYPGGSEVLTGVDLQARQGELLCILGPNGSGKTTLLKCLLAGLRPRTGSIIVAGRDVSRYGAMALARIVSYVPQTARPTFAFTAGQIVMMGRTPHMGRLGLPGELDHRVVAAAMEMTATTPFADRMLENLSGGEQQTVMIARALAQQGRIMLLDEPTSHLDVGHQLAIYGLMAKLAHEWNMAVVCVSHDLNLAARYCDRLVAMADGRVCAEGAPAEVLTEERVSELYGCAVRIETSPGGRPNVTPLSAALDAPRRSAGDAP